MHKQGIHKDSTHECGCCRPDDRLSPFNVRGACGVRKRSPRLASWAVPGCWLSPVGKRTEIHEANGPPLAFYARGHMRYPWDGTGHLVLGKHFYVGAMAHLLSKHRLGDLMQALPARRRGCGGQPT